MATIQAFVRVSSKKVEKVKVRFRLRDGRNIDLFYKSEIEVDPNAWDGKSQSIKSRVIFKDRENFNKSITDRKEAILKAYSTIPDKQLLTSDLLESKVDQVIHPEKYKSTEEVKQSFFDAYTEFLEKHKLSIGRKRHFNVVKRALQRYELYTSLVAKKPFKLNLDTISSDTLRDIEKFLKNEVTIFTTHPDIYKKIPESRNPQIRGQNTISGMFTKIRTFILWSIDARKTLHDPFKGFTVDECVYGTPYYITIDERNKLYNKELSKKQLSIQRDIFVFQCLVGCRVGDLYKFTKSSVINGAIEYIPRKTKDGRPITVRVPLNSSAKEILNRYADSDDERLFPFISEQKYNKAIKDAFTEAGITRMVTIINPATRDEEKQPINKIASSHLARRCFVGNLYKQVKDPNLVGSLTGHKEGSKAFSRYREIDEEMKIDLVNLLD